MKILAKLFKESFLLLFFSLSLIKTACAANVSNYTDLYNALNSINPTVNPYDISIDTDIIVTGTLPVVTIGNSSIHSDSTIQRALNLAGANFFSFSNGTADTMTTSMRNLDIFGYNATPTLSVSDSDTHQNSNVIYSYNQTLNLYNVTIRNNNTGITQTDGGSSNNYWVTGTIYNNAGELNINNSNFINNIVSLDGSSGIHSYAQGGAISNAGGGTLTINNSNFTGNKTTGDRGNNYLQGGAIFNGESSVVIIGTGNTFSNNSTSNGATYSAQGGVIQNSMGTVKIGDNNYFYNNSASQGGVIHSYYAATPTFIGNNNEFIGNTTDYEYGGVIYNFYSAMIIGDGNKFNNSKAGGSEGGAIYSYYSPLTIGNNNEFNQNTSTGYGGAVYLNYSDTTIGNGNKFNYNTLDSNQGGAVHAYTSLLTIGNNNEFIGNKVGTNVSSPYNETNGGALFLYTSNTTIGDGNKFNQNTGINGSGKGGAIYAHDSNLTIGNNNEFTKNAATSQTSNSNYYNDINGGAIFSNSTIRFGNNNTISDNYVSQRSLGSNAKGGAIYSGRNYSGGSIIAYLELGDNNTIMNNKAELLYSGDVGGGFAFVDSFVKIGNNNLFDGNSAVFRSSDNNSYATAQGGTFVLNSSGNTTNNLSTFGSDNIFSNNSATSELGNAQGGAISVVAAAAVEIGNNTQFINNAAIGNNNTVQGGAIYNTSEKYWNNLGTHFSIGNNALFSGNKAEAITSGWVQGGAISNDKAIMQIGDEAQFLNNLATGGSTNGGAIFNTAGYTDEKAFLSIGKNALFQGNKSRSTSSSAQGGAISNTAGSSGTNVKLTIDDGARFTNNSATSDTSVSYGGAIFNVALGGNYIADMVIGDNILFEGNFVQGTGQTLGGAINNTNGASMTLGSNIRFIKNSAMTTGNASNAYGGAIFNSYGLSSGQYGFILGDNLLFEGNSVKNSNTNTNYDSQAHGGAIWNNSTSLMTLGGNVTFRNNSAEATAISSTYFARSYGGAIWNDGSSTMTFKDNVSFIGNSSKAVGANSQGYGGALINFNGGLMTFGDNTVFKGNSTQGNLAMGGAVWVGNGTPLTFNGSVTATDNYARSSYVLSPILSNSFNDDWKGAYGGAFLIGPGTSLIFNMLGNDQNTLIENNYIAGLSTGGSEYRKLNSFYFGSGGSNLYFNTAKGNHANIRDPMSSQDNYGFYTYKTGEGSMYLWGDNSDYKSYIYVQGGSFYAMYEENQTTAQKATDPLGQRTSFSLANAAGLTFSDNTFFRPVMNSANNQLTDINNTPNLIVGTNVKLAPYGLSALAVGNYVFNNDYSRFEGWTNKLASLSTTTTPNAVNLTIKSGISGYNGLPTFADAYRMRTDLNLTNRELLDDLYMTGTVSSEIRSVFDSMIDEMTIAEGQDYQNYGQAHRAGVHQFGREIKSRVDNRNKDSDTADYDDNHLWINISKSRIEQDNTNRTIGYDYNPTGIAIGYDQDFGDGLNMGIALNYGYGDAKNKTKNVFVSAKNEIKEYLGAFYGKYKPLKGYASWAVGSGIIKNTTSFSSQSIAAKGDYTTSVGFANAELGYDFGKNGWLLEPYVGAEYTYLRSESYNEKGTGARHFDDMDWNILEVPVGVRLAKDIKSSNFTFTPALDIAYARNFGNTGASTSASFISGTGSAWKITSNHDERGITRGKLNLKINSKKHPFALNFGYGVDYRSDYTDNQFYGTLRYDF